MKNRSRLIGILFLVIFWGCSDMADQGIDIFSSAFDFNEATHGWEADFTDYPASLDEGADSMYAWSFKHTELPVYLGGRKSLMLSSNNQSSDLFMFIKKKIGGLYPNMDYTIVFEVELASSTRGAQSVILKVGATDVEPKKIIEGNSYYSLNVDKGSTLSSGEDLIMLGDIGYLSGSTDFAMITKNNTSDREPFIVRSNSKGEIWLIIGTDSVHPGLNTVYYTKVNVVFSASRP